MTAPFSAFVEAQRKEAWVAQLTVLLQDLVSSAELRGFLPTIESDEQPAGISLLGNSLGFIDSQALYRVVPSQTHDGDLGLRVTRIPFSDFARVYVGDSRNGRGWSHTNSSVVEVRDRRHLA
jgi:hypothetical protein